MKDTQDAMVTFLYLSAKEQESLRRRLSSSPSYSQPAHMFTKELDTDCSPGTNTMVAGWGQWGGRKKKRPRVPCQHLCHFCPGRKDVFCITAVGGRVVGRSDTV